MNAYLLSKFNNLILKEFAEDDVNGGWLFPVNMRGGVNKKNVFSNQSSGILINGKQDIEASNIQKQIKNELTNNKHWANWFSYHIGVLIGVGGMRYLSKRSSEKSYFLGTFTNMGEWPLPGTEPQCLHNEDEAYIVVPPGTKNYPVSVGIITWHGKTSISLKIHPSICSDRSKVKKILDQFKNEMLN